MNRTWTVEKRRSGVEWIGSTQYSALLVPCHTARVGYGSTCRVCWQDQSLGGFLSSSDIPLIIRRSPDYAAVLSVSEEFYSELGCGLATHCGPSESHGCDLSMDFHAPPISPQHRSINPITPRSSSDPIIDGWPPSSPSRCISSPCVAIAACWAPLQR